MRGVLLAFILTIIGMAASGQSSSDRLAELDRVIAGRDVYEAEKEGEIDRLRKILHRTSSLELQFSVMGQIFDLYLPYRSDSAIAYVHKREETAQKLSNPLLIAESRMNMAAVKSNTGMYKEALDILSSISPKDLNSRLRLYRFLLYRTIYGAMADFAATPDEQLYYQKLTTVSGDSILANTEPGSREHIYAQADKMITSGDCLNAISLLEGYYVTIVDDARNQAIVAYNLSEAYECASNPDKALQYLIESSIFDIKASVKEYISLWKLASVLYRRGDINRSYEYLKYSMQDATFSGARLRTIKITEIFPVIEKAYHQQLQKQKRRIVNMLLTISILSALLILAITLMIKQIKKLKSTKEILRQMNVELERLIEEQAISNKQLVKMNHSLAEASSIKEEYIGRYMDLCSNYIDKMDNSRRALLKKANNSKIDELVEELKSDRYIKEELKEFYNNFDQAFLRLFPNFIAEFNGLLREDEQITLKLGEILNTELRIYALIRLGIGDSERIATFLRYSVTTIYNYRTKMRNKAVGNREELDAQVMKTGINTVH